jgi:hypothetical protein
MIRSVGKQPMNLTLQIGRSRSEPVLGMRVFAYKTSAAQKADELQRKLPTIR